MKLLSLLNDRCGANGATYMRNLQQTNRFQSELRSQIPTTCLWASGDYQMKLRTPART